jgi:hypothetical protein
MAIFKKDLLARYIVAVLAFGLFSLSFVTSSHLAPQSERQLITLNHQVRRVLMRAERENLRSSAASDQEGIPINLPQEFGGIPQSLEFVVSYHKISASSQVLVEPESFVLDSSPVLNL